MSYPNNLPPSGWDKGCSCLDSAYERLACIQGMNINPVFPENIEWLEGKYEEEVTQYSK